MWKSSVGFDMLIRNRADTLWEDCQFVESDNPLRIRDVVTHEFGHGLGFSHSKCPYDLMFGSAYSDFLGGSDLARAAISYPAPTSELVFPENIYVKDID